ncbi:MAG: translocation/assembly module TamB domain-containing protein [Pseudomonadota bacterium]
MKRKRTVIALLLLLNLALGVAVVWWVQSPGGMRTLIGILAQRLHDEAGLQLTVDSVEADLLRASIDLSGISVRAQDQSEIFAARRLKIELTPMQLLTGRLRLERVELDTPTSRLSVVGGRIAGLPRLSRTGQALLKISVNDLRIRDGRVDIAIEDSGLLSLREIDVHIAGRDLTRHGVAFSVGGGSYDHGAYHLVLSAFSGEAEQHGDSLLEIGRVDFNRFVVGVEDTRAELSGQLDFSQRGVDHLPAADVELHLDLPLQAVQRIVVPQLPLDGLVELETRVRSKPAAVDIQADGLLMVTSPKVEDFNLGDVSLFFHATPEQVEVEHLAMAWGGSVVQGSAQLQLDRNLSARVRVRGRDLCFGEVIADMSLVGSWVNFFVDGEAEAWGQFLPRMAFKGTGQGWIRDFEVNDRAYLEAADDDAVLRLQPVQMTTALAFDADRFQFMDATLKDDRTELHGSATLNFDVQRGLEVDFTSEASDLSSVSPIVGVDFGGVGAIAGSLRGPYPDPEITAQADLENFTIERYNFGRAQGRIHYRGLVLSFLQMQAHKNQSDYRATVVLDFNDGVDLSVEAAVDGTRVEDLQQIIPRDDVGGVMSFLRDLPLTGRLSGLGVARGDIRGGTTADLTGSADLIFADSALYGQSFERGVGRGRLSLKSLFVDELVLNKGSGTLAMQGTIAREDGAIAATVQARAVPLDRMEVLDNETAPVRGEGDVDLSIGGVVTRMVATGQLQLRDLIVGPTELGEGQLKLGLDDIELDLNGTTFSGDGTFDGHITIASPFAYRASLTRVGGDLLPLLPDQVVPEDLTLSARIQATSSGYLKELSQSTGTLRLEDAELGVRGVEFAASGPIEASFAGAEFDVNRMVLRHGELDRIELRGRIGRRQLSVEIDSDLGLELVSAFTDRVIEAEGRLNLAVGISGAYTDPVLLGQGRIQGGRLVIAKFEHPIEELQGRLSLTRDTLLVDSVTARVGDAPVEGDGELRFEGLTPRHLRLQARIQAPLTLHIPASVTTRSQGMLELSGNFDALYLRGDVEVLSARYTENWDVERILPEFRRRRLVPQAFNPTDEQVNLDVLLRADDNIIVRNNVLDTELKGEVRITGTDERPGMRGTLNLLRGTAQFRGNRYELEQTTIDLVDAYRIAPILDVVAHTRTRQPRPYDIDVLMQGPLEDLRIQLQSSPELAEIDILSLITLGFTREDLRDVRTTTGTAALEVLSAYSGLDREVQRVLPLPVHEVRLSSIFSESQGTTVPSVVVGIELLEGLRLQVPYVEGAHLRLQSSLLGAAGGRSDQRVELDIRLNDSTSVRGVLDNDAERNIGDPGVDLNYRLEF